MNNLKTLRKEKNMTQKEVAVACGITQSAYNHYESGRRNLNSDMLVKLADVYDVTVDELIRKKISHDERRI